MLNCTRQTVPRYCLAVVAVLAGVLMSARPASAQSYTILPDGSVVVGTQQTFPLGGSWQFGPVTAVQGNTAVKVGGSFGGTVFKMDNSSLVPFIRPVTATDRAMASYFYGQKKNKPPITAGPFQVWW